MTADELRRAIAEALGYTLQAVVPTPRGWRWDRWHVLRHGKWTGQVSIGHGEPKAIAWDAAFESHQDGGSVIPDWTRDAGAALALCEEIATRAQWVLSLTYSHSPQPRWLAVFEERVTEYHYHNHCHGEGATPAEACARSALMYYRGEYETTDDLIARYGA